MKAPGERTGYMGYIFSFFGEGDGVMPWKEFSLMEEAFNLWRANEPMAELCREFGVSRKPGYKIFDRYRE